VEGEALIESSCQRESSPLLSQPFNGKWAGINGMGTKGRKKGGKYGLDKGERKEGKRKGMMKDLEKDRQFIRDFRKL
jgi:hypothetical protein